MRFGLLTRAALVIALGGIAMATTPAAAAAPHLGGCNWCRDSCPGDLQGYCQDHCNSGEGSCSTGGCEGTDGHFYDYTVSCGALS